MYKTTGSTPQQSVDTLGRGIRPQIVIPLFRGQHETSTSGLLRTDKQAGKKTTNVGDGRQGCQRTNGTSIHGGLQGRPGKEQNQDG